MSNGRPVTSALICMSSGVPFGQTAACDDPSTATPAPSSDSMIDARPERGRFEQCPVGVGGGGGKRRPDQQAAEPGIDEDRAIAVPPVEGKQPALARPECPGLALEDAVDVEAFAGRSSWYLRWRRLLVNHAKMSPTADWPAS